METWEAVSLLWPTAAAKEPYRDVALLSEQCVSDLGLERIVHEICINQKYYDAIKKLLLQFCSDPQVIRYRLDIMEDCMRFPVMTAELEALLPVMHKLDIHHQTKSISGAEPLRKIAWQLEELEVYVQCVIGLKAISDRFNKEIRSDGLRRLFEMADRLTEDEGFGAMAATIPDYRQKLQNMSSITLGINLDHELKPAEAIILSLESKPFRTKKRSVISGLLGLKSVDEPYMGVSPFQPIQKLSHPALDSALLNSLEHIFNDALLPIGQAIKRNIDINIPQITDLEPEIGFYIGASKFTAMLGAVGLRMCKPEIAPAEERICQIDGMIDPVLAIGFTRRHPGIDLSRSVVANDVEFGERGRIFILTGPNQGGKTTYTRAIGAAQALFQAGLYVPGTIGCSPISAKKRSRIYRMAGWARSPDGLPKFSKAQPDTVSFC